ncbi:class F sortase [Nocardioides sp. AE5]|uniref:class F sortase n=1 Tax=Nocardioides sp. AE5 TaxID=2962573 RepID=UPI0028823FE6|nr:class F sortase [Nocardioides sp. AE5]MDT0201936.1 class F sortase [Nocardioides sp. AE5]
MSRSRMERIATIAVAAVAALLVVIGAWRLLAPDDDVTTRDLNGDPVALEPGTVPTDDQLERMRAVDDEGERFRVPEADLDVPLGGLDVVDNTINPPGFTSAYLVRNLGVPLDEAAEGTVYVVMHSLRGGVGPGNHLIDVESQSSRLEQGAEIVIGDHTWLVTGDLTVAKFDLGAQGHLFDESSGRLVVITCQQRPDGSAAVDNLVITAQLVA